MMLLFRNSCSPLSLFDAPVTKYVPEKFQPIQVCTCTVYVTHVLQLLLVLINFAPVLLIKLACFDQAAGFLKEILIKTAKACAQSLLNMYLYVC